MKEIALKLDGMSCGSCEKIIAMVAEQNGASVKGIDAGKGEVVLLCEEDDAAVIRQQLAEKGFGERKEDAARGDPGRLTKYLLSILAGEPHVKAESMLMNHAAGAAVALVALASLGYAAGAGGGIAYAPLAFLAILGTVVTLSSYRHIACYRKNMTCTNGMMAGMTVGMISGFLLGALVGATNGMFVGSVAGMATGMALGGNLGRYAGVMGAMEGLMAGLMSGIMGAMTSVMLVNDNLLAFLYLLFGACAAILGGLSYMMHREAGPAAESSAGFASFLATSMIFSIALVALMVYGPKGPISYP